MSTTRGPLANEECRIANGEPPIRHSLFDAQHSDKHVAIVGMACTFPGARNLREFWRNIVGGVDAIGDAPPQRWDSDVFYNPTREGGIYCKRGGYLGTSFIFNPLKCGTMPRAIQGAEPEQFLVLRAVYEAIEDAGYLHERKLPGERTAVILGRGNYLGAGVTGLVQRGMITEQTLQILRSLHPEVTPEDIEAIRREMQASLPAFAPDTAPGLIPNVVSGRVANRLDLMGPTFTIDAACASSLIATDLGVRGLLSGQHDAVLVGGVHLFADVSFLQVFCAMGALSRSSTIRPYDRDCDGTISGEGAGILLLKRLADAQRDGDRIYAVIRGIGTSSDGKAMGVTAPRVEGEVLALRRAYEMAGVDPSTVELIEGHGTGTPVGDPTEIEALRSVFGPRRSAAPDVALGSIKSMIGHAMPAAGAAALIKTALSLYHGVLPPTLNCRKPHELLAASDSRFYVNSKTRPWLHASEEHPRRAGVNAFGFGGVNAHVVLEEYATHPGCVPAGRHENSLVPARRDWGKIGSGSSSAIGTTEPSPTHPSGTSLSRSADSPALQGGAILEPAYGRPASLLREWDTELFVVGAPTREALQREVDGLRHYALTANKVSLCDLAFTLNSSIGEGLHRLCVVASSLAELVEKLTYAAQRLADAECKQIKDGKGIYYVPESSSRGGKIAFLFPGLGAQYVNLMSDLCLHFPEVRACFEDADRAMSATGERISSDIFPPPAFLEDEERAQEARLAQIERANPAVMTANGAMYLLLERLGLKADMMTGHSSGEWVVMPASGMVSVREFVSSMSKLGDMWRKLNSNAAVPHRVMLAVGTDRETVAKLAAEIEKPIHVANDNCKHQVVVVVDPAVAEEVTQRLRARGVLVERLPYAHGYHTDEFTYVTDALRDYFSSMDIQPPKAELYSCTTAKKYPKRPREIVNLLAHTFAKPLLFRDTVEAMYADGARIFVEVGPRGNLTAFADDVLRGRPHTAIATNQHRKSGITALHHALAQLAALHVPLKLDELYVRRGPKKLTLDAIKDQPIDEAAEPGAVQVSLCAPRMSIKPRAAINASPSPQHKTEDTLRAPHAEPEGVPPKSGACFPVSQPAATLAPPSPAAQCNREIALQNHLRVMEQFLQVNEEIMRAFLRGQTPVPGAAGPGAPGATAGLSASASPAGGEFVAASASVGNGTGPQAPAAAQIETAAPVQAQSAPPVQIAAKPSEAVPSPQRSLETVLLGIVSERTGYPPEMLDLDLDMEADLGIDSIKRVEILGALQQVDAGSSEVGGGIDMEEVARLKTLRQIIGFLGNTTRAVELGRQDKRLNPRIEGIPHYSPLGDTGEPPTLVGADAGDGVRTNGSNLPPRESEIPNFKSQMNAERQGVHSPSSITRAKSTVPPDSEIEDGPTSHAALKETTWPFAVQAIAHTPGQELTVERSISVREDLYLHDHCFDPYISDADPARERLCIVPLTVSLEMMAEVANRLVPEQRVVGARNVQAAKWIEVEPGTPQVTIIIHARRRDNARAVGAAGAGAGGQSARRAGESEIYVTLSRKGNGSAAPQPMAEGTFVLADTFPGAPTPAPLELSNAGRPANTAKQMYDERRMFHGPRFRGVVSIDAVGENGLQAELEVLPLDNLLQSNIAPRFIIDPFLLDAAGQLVGYWPVEYLSEGFVLFPIRIQELTLYRHNLSPGQRAECRLRIADVSKRQLRANMDLIAPDGSLWMRITGWEDWRFYWDETFYNFWRYPNRGMVSEHVELPLPEPDEFECRRMTPFGEMGSSIWENLWAHLIMSAGELEQYRRMGDGARRTEWIFGRAAAKDAVRAWIKRQHGVDLYPADVVIVPDANGKPIAAGHWLAQVGEAPQVSIAHKGSTAIAIAGLAPLGIDLEVITAHEQGFERLAFTEAERELIACATAVSPVGALETRQSDTAEWITRVWSAKEAAGKAAGTGLAAGPKSYEVRRIDALTGDITVAANASNALIGFDATAEFSVKTMRDGDFVIAVAMPSPLTKGGSRGVQRLCERSSGAVV